MATDNLISITRLTQTFPIVAGVAVGIAKRMTDLSELPAAITAKIAEWHEPLNGDVHQALTELVYYYALTGLPE